MNADTDKVLLVSISCLRLATGELHEAAAGVEKQAVCGSQPASSRACAPAELCRHSVGADSAQVVLRITDAAELYVPYM